MPFAPVPCVCLCGLPGVCFLLWILIQCHFSLKSFQLWISGDLGIVWRVPSTIIVSVHVQVCTCVYACICNMCMYVCIMCMFVYLCTHIYTHMCAVCMCVLYVWCFLELFFIFWPQVAAGWFGIIFIPVLESAASSRSLGPFYWITVLDPEIWVLSVGW